LGRKGRGDARTTMREMFAKWRDACALGNWMPVADECTHCDFKAACRLSAWKDVPMLGEGGKASSPRTLKGILENRT